MVDGFAEVVQKACALSGNRIETKLGSHNAAQVRDFERVVQNALAERGAEAQAAKRANELGMQVVNTNVERRLLASLLDLLVHELFGLRVHLFDASGMNAAVGDEVFHGDAANFTTNGIEARNGYALRRVVDEQVYARKLLEAANIATFATDNAALQVVGRNVDGFHRGFGRVIGGDALNCEAQDFARLLVGFSLGTLLGLANNGGAFMRDLIAKVVEQFLLRLFGRHAGDMLEAHIYFLNGTVQIALTTLDLTLHGRELMLAGIEALDAAINGFLALRNAVFGGTNFLHALFVLSLSFLLHLEHFVFGFNHSFAAHGFCLALRLRYHLFSLFMGAFGGRICDVAGNKIATGDANGQADDQKCDFHRPPLSSNFIYEDRLPAKKMPGICLA